MTVDEVRGGLDIDLVPKPSNQVFSDSVLARRTS